MKNAKNITRVEISGEGICRTVCMYVNWTRLKQPHVLTWRDNKLQHGQVLYTCWGRPTRRSAVNIIYALDAGYLESRSYTVADTRVGVGTRGVADDFVNDILQRTAHGTRPRDVHYTWQCAQRPGNVLWQSWERANDKRNTLFLSCRHNTYFTGYNICSLRLDDLKMRIYNCARNVFTRVRRVLLYPLKDQNVDKSVT